MKSENWWIKEDCRECIRYPKCDFIETASAKPRGCSLFEKVATCFHCHGHRLFRNWYKELECLDCGHVHYDNPDLDAPVLKDNKVRVTR